MSLDEETSDIRQGQEIDPVRLTAYLESVIPDCRPPLCIKQFKGGQSNPTYLIKSGLKSYVLRKKPPGDLLPSAHQVDREYKIMAALARTNIPVPRVHALCEDPSIIGTSFFVMDGIEGRVFRDTTLPGLSARDRHGLYDAMNRCLADIHQIDWKSVGLSDFGKPTDYAKRQVARWSRQYVASKTHQIPAMDDLMEWLPKNIPEDDQATIAHGDYRLENLIFHPGEARVLAVLDWELATIGHPLSDLGFNCMNYHLPSSLLGLGGLEDIDIAPLGIPSEQEYVETYCQRSGRRLSADEWRFFIVFSLFRCAAILQGVYARAVAKTASSSDALQIGRQSATVAETAWRQAMDR